MFCTLNKKKLIYFKENKTTNTVLQSVKINHTHIITFEKLNLKNQNKLKLDDFLNLFIV